MCQYVLLETNINLIMFGILLSYQSLCFLQNINKKFKGRFIYWMSLIHLLTHLQNDVNHRLSSTKLFSQSRTHVFIYQTHIFGQLDSTTQFLQFLTQSSLYGMCPPMYVSYYVNFSSKILYKRTWHEQSSFMKLNIFLIL